MSTRPARSSWFVRACRTCLFVHVCTALALTFLSFFVFYPPGDLYYSPLSIKYPYAELPTWGVQEIYHDPITHAAVFQGHKDRVVDWVVPPTQWLYGLAEKFVHFVEVTLPSKVVPPPAHLLHLLQGPGQLQVLRSLILLGVPDLLADRVLSLRDLHVALRSPAHQSTQAGLLRAGLLQQETDPLPQFDQLPLAKLERVMSFAVAMGYFEEVGYRGSHIYVHNAQSVILRSDHPNNLNHLLFHFSNEAYLAWHNLFHALLQPEDEHNLESELVDAQPHAMPQEPLAATGVDEEPWNRGQGIRYTGPHSTERVAQVKAGQTERQRARRQRREAKVAELRQALVRPPSKPASSTAAAAAPALPPTAWEVTFRSGLWSFFNAHPSIERSFARAMSQVDNFANQALVSDFDWAHVRLGGGGGGGASSGSGEVLPLARLVDVGGSLGSFLARVLAAHSTIPRATLFDLAPSIQTARAAWKPDAGAEHAAIVQRTDVALVAGDFFDASSLPRPDPAGPTRYVLRQILHDWPDHDSMRILRNLRQVAGDRRDVSVVLVEANKAPAENNAVRHWIDFQMLVCCNAKERSMAEWEMLLEVTGWKLVQSVRTRSLFQIMELQPAPEAEQTEATTATPTRANASAQAAKAAATGGAAAAAATATPTASPAAKQEL